MVRNIGLSLTVASAFATGLGVSTSELSPPVIYPGDLSVARNFRLGQFVFIAILIHWIDYDVN